MKIKHLILLVVLALFVVACSNQQPGTDSIAGTDSTTTGAEEKVMPAPAQNEESALANLLKSKQNLKYMVEWDINTQAQGQTINSKMTQYFMDAKHFRTDMITSGMEVRSYFVNDVMSSCFNVGGTWTCQQITYQPGTDAQAENNIIAGKIDYKVTKLLGRTIAGTMTECYRAEVEQVVVAYCFSSEGVPLYIKTEAAGVSSEMTATKYSTAVTEAMFELPI